MKTQSAVMSGEKKDSEPAGATIVDVALCVGNDVLCKGLEATIEQIDCARFVGLTTPPEARLGQLEDNVWHHARPVPSCCILMVTFDEWPLVEEWNEFPEGQIPKVLVVGDATQLTQIGRLYDLPADGFLALPDLSAASLGDAFRRIAAGDMPMPASLARQLLSGDHSRTSRVRKHRTVLTERESETLSLLAEGLSNKQIARTLKISSHGAKRLVGAILLKLGAPNRTAAVVIAINAGILAMP